MLDEEWREKAKCRDVPTELFFPTRDDDHRDAVNVCFGVGGSSECPVRSACLEFALSTNQEHGVWGGTTVRERRRLRRARSRARRFDGRVAG